MHKYLDVTAFRQKIIIDVPPIDIRIGEKLLPDSCYCINKNIQDC